MKKKSQRKSEFAQGLEFMMNKSGINPFTSDHGAQVFKQMIHATNLPMNEMMKHISTKSRNLEQERIRQRLDRLEN